MALPLLVIKTGTTIPSLLARGEDFEHWFAGGLGLGLEELRVCDLYRDEPLPPLDSISGIVITGSPAFITDAAPWNKVGADYCRAARDHLPILGICYGHQLLAWAFGGEVGFHPKGREIGTVKIALTDLANSDPLFSSLPPQFSAQASHSQSVLRLPEEAELLAYNDFDPNHAFRLGENIWSVQFHPEFSANVTRAYIKERAEAIAKEGLDPELLLKNVGESPEAASLLPRFLQLVRENTNG